METAKRDIEIQHLNNLMKDLKHNLSEKHKDLVNVQKHNPYLRGVVDDYNTYFNSINDEKLRQYNALKQLHNYVTQLSIDPTATEEIIRQSKYDIAIIVDELRKIKL
jgi:hypothetical protein